MHPFRRPAQNIGRPREYELTPDQALRYMQLVQRANVDRRSGSASMAWRVLCQEYPDIGWTAEGRESKHDIPAVARELARRANALTALHRQGERGLRSAAAYAPGSLRLADGGSRRLWAGERVSFDDATPNFGVVIPWPWGGCKLSDKYGVKLGRFQLLLPHDEASGYVPCWTHVVRDSQGYRAVDATAAVVRFFRDVCLPVEAVLEGGVWQGLRMKKIMQATGVKPLSVKGRPWQKMVENFFNRLWTRVALEPGLTSVGRFRGEEKSASELYVKCRAGAADPRGRFPSLEQAVQGMENAIHFLNHDRIESARYGKWIPAERWARDLAENPRPALGAAEPWMVSPVSAKRRVSRNGISVAADGPGGLRMKYQFTGPDLWEWEGKDVEIYFDPLSEWPLEATVCKPGTAVVIARATCSNPYHEGGDPDAAKRLRETMRAEYRVLWRGGQALEKAAGEGEIRAPEGTARVLRGEPADDLTTLDRRTPGQRPDREVRARDGGRLEPDPRLNSGGPAGSGRWGAENAPARPVALKRLGERAAQAREQTPNW